MLLTFSKAIVTDPLNSAPVFADGPVKGPRTPILRTFSAAAIPTNVDRTKQVVTTLKINFFLIMEPSVKVVF
jgi:hypothetical protein